MIVCPYCVQWRCTAHQASDCWDCTHNGDGQFEPYWPDGTAATITQNDPCERCAVTLAAYEADKDPH